MARSRASSSPITTPFPSSGIMVAMEHGVEPGREAGELGAAAGERQAGTGLTGRDGVGLLDERADRLEHGTGQEPAAEGDGGGEDGQAGSEGELELLLQAEGLV